MIKQIKLEELVIDLLGPLGRKLPSPVENTSNNTTLTNAEIFISGSRVWYGDIDYVLYKERLKSIANFCNKNVLIIKNDKNNFQIFTVKPG